MIDETVPDPEHAPSTPRPVNQAVPGPGGDGIGRRRAGAPDRLSARPVRTTYSPARSQAATPGRSNHRVIGLFKLGRDSTAFGHGNPTCRQECAGYECRSMGGTGWSLA